MHEVVWRKSTELVDDRAAQTYFKLNPRIGNVDFSECTQLTDRIVTDIPKSLIDLDISKTNLSDQFLVKLQSKKVELQKLNLWGCRKMTSDVVIKFVKAMPSLKVLFLGTKDEHFKDAIDTLKDIELNLIITDEPQLIRGG